MYDLEHSLSCGQSARPSDPIITYHDWPGTDGLAHRRAWDRATLQGLVAWARAVPPDGSNEWWAHLWGVARIIDTKGTLGTIGFGFGSIQKPLFAAGGMPPPTPRASLRDEWVQIVQSAAAAPELAAAPSPAAAPAPAAASAPAPSAAGSSSDWWAAAIAEHARRREEGLERWRAYQVVREERERAALEQQRAASAAAPRTPRATRTINESYDPEDGVSFEAAAIPTPPLSGVGTNVHIGIGIGRNSPQRLICIPGPARTATGWRQRGGLCWTDSDGDGGRKEMGHCHVLV